MKKYKEYNLDYKTKYFFDPAAANLKGLFRYIATANLADTPDYNGKSKKIVRPERLPFSLRKEINSRCLAGTFVLADDTFMSCNHAWTRKKENVSAFGTRREFVRSFVEPNISHMTNNLIVMDSGRRLYDKYAAELRNSGNYNVMIFKVSDIFKKSLQKDPRQHKVDSLALACSRLNLAPFKLKEKSELYWEDVNKYKIRYSSQPDTPILQKGFVDAEDFDKYRAKLQKDEDGGFIEGTPYKTAIFIDIDMHADKCQKTLDDIFYTITDSLYENQYISGSRNPRKCRYTPGACTQIFISCENTGSLASLEDVMETSSLNNFFIAYNCMGLWHASEALGRQRAPKVLDACDVSIYLQYTGFDVAEYLFTDENEKDEFRKLDTDPNICIISIEGEKPIIRRKCITISQDLVVA